MIFPYGDAIYHGGGCKTITNMSGSKTVIGDVGSSGIEGSGGD